MFFQSWYDFLTMGGYGIYVWISYGISFLAVLILVIQSMKEKHVLLSAVYRKSVSRQNNRSMNSKTGKIG